jgi:hypothetical protein
MTKNVSVNSIEIYHSEIKGDKEDNQDQVILKALLKNQPCTAVQLEKVLPQPQYKINVITRSLYNLREKKKLIEVAYTDKCNITKRKAAHYRVIPTANQTSLF